MHHIHCSSPWSCWQCLSPTESMQTPSSLDSKMEYAQHHHFHCWYISTTWHQVVRKCATSLSCNYCHTIKQSLGNSWKLHCSKHLHTSNFKSRSNIFLLSLSPALHWWCESSTDMWDIWQFIHSCSWLAPPQALHNLWMSRIHCERHAVFRVSRHQLNQHKWKSSMFTSQHFMKFAQLNPQSAPPQNVLLPLWRKNPKFFQYLFHCSHPFHFCTCTPCRGLSSSEPFLFTSLRLRTSLLKASP